MMGEACLREDHKKTNKNSHSKFVGVMSRPAESSTAPEARFPAPEPGATEPEPETGARVSGGQARGARPSTVPWQRTGGTRGLVTGWTGEPMGWPVILMPLCEKKVKIWFFFYSGPLYANVWIKLIFLHPRPKWQFCTGTDVPHCHSIFIICH